ncbi:MAG: hypothetical protein U5K00_13520 [Melioribacteraceae bacterium]|nr:hypothetical protein [Melioribacteraceae bacterium]
MKKFLFIVIVSMIFSNTLFAQLYTLRENQGMLDGGFGVTWIDGQPFYSFYLRPEFAFSKIGVWIRFQT